MKINILLLVTTLLLTGCSAEWHLRQAVRKNSDLVKPQTISVWDTVVTEPIAVRDTVTLSKVDTIEIIKDKFRVKIMRSYDTLIIDGGCDADTIIRTVSIEAPVVEYRENDAFFDKIYETSFYILIIGITVLTIRSAIRKHLG